MQAKVNTYILMMLLVIFLISFGNLILNALERPSCPEPLSFAHRWGICTLSMFCGDCLDDNGRRNSALDLCWERHDMDRHIEIFGY
jgi:hypothetical protein